MPFIFEKQKQIYCLSLTGFISLQDAEAVIKQIDEIVESEPEAKILIDYSNITNFEEKCLKLTFDRMEQGFPSGVRFATVFHGKGILGPITKMVNAAVARTKEVNSKLFDNREDAWLWLES